MFAHEEAAGRPRRGLAAKRDAITRAARTVFGRDGYTAAGIDAIAAEAGVSKRTVYNHFTGKEDLFASILHESTRLVAEALTGVIERCLDAPDLDVETGLISLGRAWAAVQTEYADHFALVQRIRAEAAHVPPEILRSWHEAGPKRAQNALALRLRHLADRGVLHIDDPARSAAHFVWLVLGEISARSHYGLAPLSEEEVDELVAAGVRVFLYGCLPR